jgi:hypothetical protein
MRAFVAVLLVIVLGAVLAAPAMAMQPENPHYGEDQPCEWCIYVPSWCFLCLLYYWWEEGGCFPGDPLCD